MVDKRNLDTYVIIALRHLGDGWTADVSYRIWRSEKGEYIQSSATISLEKCESDL